MSRILPLGTSLIVAELSNMNKVIASWEKFLKEGGFPHVDEPRKDLSEEQLRDCLMNFVSEMLYVSDMANSMAVRLSNADFEDL